MGIQSVVFCNGWIFPKFINALHLLHATVEEILDINDGPLINMFFFQTQKDIIKSLPVALLFFLPFVGYLAPIIG